MTTKRDSISSGRCFCEKYNNPIKTEQVSRISQCGSWMSARQFTLPILAKLAFLRVSSKSATGNENSRAD